MEGVLVGVGTYYVDESEQTAHSTPSIGSPL